MGRYGVVKRIGALSSFFGDCSYSIKTSLFFGGSPTASSSTPAYVYIFTQSLQISDNIYGVQPNDVMFLLPADYIRYNEINAPRILLLCNGQGVVPHDPHTKKKIYTQLSYAPNTQKTNSTLLSLVVVPYKIECLTLDEIACASH